MLVENQEISEKLLSAIFQLSVLESPKVCNFYLTLKSEGVCFFRSGNCIKICTLFRSGNSMNFCTFFRVESRPSFVDLGVGEILHTKGWKLNEVFSTF
jgi:hypothetical protein